MKKGMEWQVTGRELSKRLKELGVKQESIFFWGYDSQQGFEGGLRLLQSSSYTEQYAAFTVAELGEMLTPHLDGIKDVPSEYGLKNQSFYIQLFSADYWAKLLCYLLENKLITAL